MESLQDYLDKLHRVSGGVNPPHLLVCADGGGAEELAAQVFGRYRDLGLWTFDGSLPWLVLTPGPGDGPSLPARLARAVIEAQGLSARFRGGAALDLRDLLPLSPADARALARLMCGLEEEISFLLLAPSGWDHTRSPLGQLLRLRAVTLPPPPAQELTGRLLDLLDRLGASCTGAGQAALDRYLGAVAARPGFEGTATLERMAHVLQWESQLSGLPLEEEQISACLTASFGDPAQAFACRRASIGFGR